VEGNDARTCSCSFVACFIASYGTFMQTVNTLLT